MIRRFRTKSGYEKYDIVAANILADVLVELTPVIVSPAEKRRDLHYQRYYR